MNSNQKIINLNLILAVVFVDLLGAGIVIPILSVIFDSANFSYLSNYSSGFKNIVYGSLIAVYPIFQLFGAPILGYLSDNFGRKKILGLSILGTILSYILFVIGISTTNILVLFLSRAIDGFTGGNIFIAHSMISDISDKKNKAKNLGLINISLGLGLILGPSFGGFLTDASLFNLPPIAMPYFFAAVLATINLILMIFFLKETKITANKIKHFKTLHIFASFEQVFKAFNDHKLRLLFFISFLSSLSFSLFSNFFPFYLATNFDFGAKSIGLLTAYIGVWMAIGAIFILPYLNKTFSDSRLMYLNFFLVGFSLCLSLVPENPIWFYFILPAISIGMSLISTCIISLLTHEKYSDDQGGILGVNQSIQAFATTAPVIGGFLSSYWIKLPILVAAIATFVGFWLVYYRYDLKK